MSLLDKVLDAPFNLVDKIVEQLPPILDYYNKEKKK